MSTSSRDRILNTLRNNVPAQKPLPSLNEFINNTPEGDVAARFIEVVRNIGGAVIEAPDLPTAAHYIKQNYAGKRVVSMAAGIESLTTQPTASDPHLLADVELAVINTHFAVAENGACWVTAELLGDRALPFIAQQLALIVMRPAIVPTMHAAYQKIADGAHPFGTFIAGPSKTADIEQSLVLGAHGPKSLTVFLI